MDRVDRYREIVRSVLSEYASIKYAHGDIRSRVIIDAKIDHYELMRIGWDRHRYIHGYTIHIDIIGGKIWIQYDGTDRPFADELERAGVPREDIVLGFIPERERQHTGYAVA
jgi:hypothetical protein